MRTTSKLAALATGLVIAAAPAAALANLPGTEPSHPIPVTEPNHALPHDYGKYCAGESRRHDRGDKRSDFGRCVKDMARLAAGEVHSPAQACRNESKRHEAGAKDTAFSRCVAGGDRLLKDESQAGGGGGYRK